MWDVITPTCPNCNDTIVPVSHSLAFRSADDVTIDCWWRHNEQTIVTRAFEKWCLKPRSHCADLAVPISTWQHRTDILEVCSVGKRSVVIWKPVRQCFIVKLCRIGRAVATIYPWIDFSRVRNRKRLGTVVPSVRALWTACGHSWTACVWSWRSDQYNHSKLYNWCDFYVFIYFKICIYLCIYVYLLILWVYTHELRATVPC